MVTLTPIGIIQGRLTPSPDGRLQFFPKDNWREEFALASKLGFAAIEPILESEDWEKNPLIDDGFLQEMRKLPADNRVLVVSVCADIFMDYPLHRIGNPKEKAFACEVLRKLIDNCQRIGVKTIVMPVLERSEIKDEQEKEELCKTLQPFLNRLMDADIAIAFESSMPAAELADFVDSFRHSKIGVNYDIGNAVFYGFDIVKEIRLLGKRIFDVHVKDRKVGGSSVLLGTGDADFRGAFRALFDVGYRNPLIMQAARDEGDHVIENAERNIDFVKHILK